MDAPHTAKPRVHTWLRPKSGAVPAWLWVVSLGVWVAFSIGLWLWPMGGEEQSALYHTMAALAEAMAAILGLVFTISLVVAELTASYSHRLFQRLLTPFTIGYVVLFIVTIVLPLTLMPEASVSGVKVSLTLGVLALALLLPYFRYFLYRITPGAMLEDLGRAAEKTLRAGEASEDVDTIDNIGMSAFEFKDYDTFSISLATLGNLALVIPAGTANGAAAEDDIWERFRDVTLAALGESRASRISIMSLQKTGVQAAELGRTGSVRKAAGALETVGTEAVDKGLDTVSRQVVYALGEIGRAAATGKLEDAASEALYTLRKVGVAATEKRLKHTVPFALDAVESVGAVASAGEQAATTRQVAAVLMELGVEATEHTMPDAAKQAAFALQGLQVRTTGAEAVAQALKSLQAGSEGREAVTRFLAVLAAEND